MLSEHETMNDLGPFTHRREDLPAAVVDAEPETQMMEMSVYTLRVKPDRRCETQPFAGPERRHRREML
jgi:hypothetical protein